MLKEDATRRRGRDARRFNMVAAKIVGEVVRSTLGPRGMDKMLVDAFGNVKLTNDGATILDEIEVQNPSAKIMVDIAKVQDREVGDGTTTVVVLAAELLKKAEELLSQGIHPTTIVSGYRLAAQKAIRLLNKIAVPVDISNHDVLKEIAMTSIRSKGVEEARELFSEISVEAIKRIVEKRGKSNIADIDNIQIVKKEGRSILETELVRGLILEKDFVHPKMPKTVRNAKIALIDSSLEVEKTELNAEIRIDDPDKMQAFVDEENRMMQQLVDKIRRSGANVVFCKKGISDAAQHFLGKYGISAVRNISKSDMDKLTKATGGRIATSLTDLKPGYLGRAGAVEERKIGDAKMVFIEYCRNPRAVSIFVRGGLERLVDEAERALIDSLSVVSDVVEKNKIVAGGGAVEAELAKRLRRYARMIGGREQLAVEAFADSLESIPHTLAENAGLDPVNIILSLRSAHERGNGLWWGVDVFSGKIVEMMKKGVIEPTSVKEQAIKSAEEAASTILRIDDVLVAARKEPKVPVRSPIPH